MSEVGKFTVTTMSGKKIEEIVDVNEDDCYSRSVHPHQIISQKIKTVMAAQERLGDPVSHIDRRHFWTDDTWGDEQYTGIC